MISFGLLVLILALSCDVHAQSSSTFKRNGIPRQTRDRNYGFTNVFPPMSATSTNIHFNSSEPTTSQLNERSQVQRQGCGWRNPHGVISQTEDDDDSKSRFGEFSWTVAIYEVSEYPYAFLGTGSLIHPSVVLTSAMVVANSITLTVRAGIWNTKNPNDDYEDQIRDVRFVKIHEKYNPRSTINNIALVFLLTPVKLEPHVGLVCLPQRSFAEPDNVNCFASGWGSNNYENQDNRPTILQKMVLSVVNNWRCLQMLRTTRLGWRFRLHMSFMCAKFQPGKQMCQNFRGTPLVCPAAVEEGEERYEQIGIASFGIDCGKDGTPGVFVKVSRFRDWIDRIMYGYSLNSSVYSL